MEDPRRHPSEHAAIELEPDLPGHDLVQNFVNSFCSPEEMKLLGFCQVVGKDEAGGM